ncbi:nicotinamide-nucleotide amidase [Halovenus aranensis]|jgi:nicotinamide-nucleotide amidase|uniref:Nicotinamide-nucleotide amidase n=1 Tax=Halovenus aranensis TaxID=890420 RepID=A0A1G8TQ01_9EURY|nr:CinA family protein [Halovenus aranensis]SDJ42995.1 nicotinamide-nucleotide amidase [Halovenus aranensis]
MDSSLAQRVGQRLRERDQTLALAESCTGGLLASTLTDVPGSSDYFDRSMVTYSNAAKQELLGVSRESLDTHGAVSEPVAVEMAAGARDTASTTWGVSTTGIAGPGGGTDEKPVGTVCIGVAYAGPWGSDTSTAEAERYEFDGDRAACKAQFVDQALSDLLSALETR